ncbi:MAG: VOC family protein [Parvibaculum sp.]|uniref:VOC family protein n=1 Tax=Parvibaculum sp. TaxID=2024848 RepID=UPI00284E23A4|nr:VOC family protein [Parvibaculum sp.]MDR3500059.1 VOC family protein [Parvibaculum sp.]
MSRFLGEVRQVGYVVRDIEAAMKSWIETLGVGPWYYIDRVPMRDFVCRGVAGTPQVSIALANSGAVQIELIEQRDMTASMYREFLDGGHEGAQHISYWIDDFDAGLAKLLAGGYEVGQSGNIGKSGRFAYLTHRLQPATVIEISEVNGAKGRFFAEIAEAARTWDGSDPIRRMDAPRRAPASGGQETSA